MKKLVGFFGAIHFILIVGCKQHDDLTLARSDYNGNLRLNGVYYNSNHFEHAYFFYKNGVSLIPCNNLNNSTIQEKYSCSLDPVLIKDFKSSISSWGVFTINGTSISTEGWYARGDGYFITKLSKGVIVNDTTIIIDYKYRTSPPSDPDTLHFATFSPKPDSTNDFIK